MSNGGRPSTKRRPQKRRITEDEKNKIAARIQEGIPRNEIAREMGRAAGSITRIAKERGLSFDRSSTKHATEARRADHAAELVEIQTTFLAETRRAFTELHAPALVYNWHQGTFNTGVIPEPDFKSKRDIMWRAGSAIQNYLAIDNRGTSGGQEAQTALEAFFKEAREEGERRDG